MPPLELSAVLEEVANGHARDMAANDFLDHTGSDGSRPSDRTTRAGYAWKRIAENVAAGQTRAEDVAATWLESPGHCANLMDPRHMDTGIAYAIDVAIRLIGVIRTATVITLITVPVAVFIALSRV